MMTNVTRVPGPSRTPQPVPECVMTTPLPLCTGTEAGGQQFEWDGPLTRLLLLLEIADGPDWLREAAEARASAVPPCRPPG